MDSVQALNCLGADALLRGRKDCALVFFIRALEILQSSPTRKCVAHHDHDMEFDFESVPTFYDESSSIPVLDKVVRIKMLPRHTSLLESLAAHQMVTAVVMYNMALTYHAIYQKTRDAEACTKARRIYRMASECLLDDQSILPIHEKGVLALGLAAVNNGAVLAQEQGDSLEAQREFEYLLQVVEFALTGLDCCNVLGEDQNLSMLHDIHMNALMGSMNLFSGIFELAPAA